MSNEFIDKGLDTVFQRMADGVLHVVKARDPADLEKAGVGDTLVMTASEGVGRTVEQSLLLPESTGRQSEIGSCLV